ncbi:hypothetical protein BS47DRAFT_1254934, partial [Hydnum rufescens UP504]
MLIDWVIEQASRGFPFTHHMLREKAQALLRMKRANPNFTIGKQWTHTFIAKHGAHVSTYWSSSLDQ